MNASCRPSRRLPAALAAAVLAGALALVPGAAAAPLPAPAPAAADLGPADPAAPVDLVLGLRGRDPAGRAAFLAALHDPAAPGYGTTLSPADWGARFGLAAADEAALVAELTAAGLTVTHRAPQRTLLGVRGSVAAVSAWLGVPLGTIVAPEDGSSRVVAGAPLVVPAGVADVVTGITGLDRYLPVAAQPAPPTRGLKPADLGRAYGLDALRAAGFDGSGVNVAIVQFGRDTDADLAVFDATFGITGPAPDRIAVDEGISPDRPEGFDGEAALDTQVVRATAPGATILVYGFPFRTSIALAVDRIVADGRADIISISYGKCFDPGDTYISEIEVQIGSQVFAAAAAAGVTVYAAAGDWGAYSCSAFDRTDHRPTTFWPSCADNVVSVGGTFLETNDDGSWLRETGWQDYLVTGGTGGGLNPVEPRPAWQSGRGVENARSDGMRQCPDIAAAADPDTGYLVYQASDGWSMIGGTSAATPLWAGIHALVSQAARERGRGVDGTPGRLGFLAPLLYRIAAETPAAFNDVRRGGNLLDAAGPGWDYATGLGTPRAAELAEAIIAALPEAP